MDISGEKHNPDALDADRLQESKSVNAAAGRRGSGHHFELDIAGDPPSYAAAGVDLPSGISSSKKNRFLDFLKARPFSDYWLQKLRFAGHADRLGSGAAPPAQAGQPTRRRRRRLRVPFVRKINWAKLRSSFRKWIRQPMNVAFFIWLLFVAACLIMLGLLMSGILNGAIPSESVRKRWTEITNQILNALFTIICIYQHPRLFHHLILLFSSSDEAAVELRKVYCKGGSRRPHERAHISFVVVLLHITCFSQYGLCALYWGFSEKTRPDWAEILCDVVGIVSPIIAGLYTVYSPLGRRILPTDDDDEETSESELELEEEDCRVMVAEPEWVGGVFDVLDDGAVCAASTACTVCVFGWNMERLGFGNMYVHIVTFVLFLVAPFWVFSVAAINISDDTVRFVMVGVGASLCFMGLMYGGFWRTQMRKRFGLPASRWCCGWPSMTDFLQWFMCSCCSLAQEVRTANFYDVDEEGFYWKGVVTGGEGEVEVVVVAPPSMLSPGEAEMVSVEGKEKHRREEDWTRRSATAREQHMSQMAPVFKVEHAQTARF